MLLSFLHSLLYLLPSVYTAVGHIGAAVGHIGAAVGHTALLQAGSAAQFGAPIAAQVSIHKSGARGKLNFMLKAEARNREGLMPWA